MVKIPVVEVLNCVVLVWSDETVVCLGEESIVPVEEVLMRHDVPRLQETCISGASWGELIVWPISIRYSARTEEICSDLTAASCSF